GRGMVNTMPRKKAVTVQSELLYAGSHAPGSAIDFRMPAIACPACKSKISADGKTLHEKSSYLDELVETDAGVDEVEKKIEKMQKTVTAHEATIADLRAQPEEVKKKPANLDSDQPDVGKKAVCKPKTTW